jgi:hypothetical protein
MQEIPKASFIGDMTFGYDGSATGADKWSLVRWMVFEGQNLDYNERQLESGKALNTDTLDSAVSALNDLKIVSVVKKPAGLASALREGTPLEMIEMTAAMQESMQETGFWLVEFLNLREKTRQAKIQLLSNEGDIQLRLKNGIVYHLRFGDLTGTESEVPAEQAQFGSPLAMDATKMVPNRHLFITAEFDPAMIPPAESRPVPEIPEEGEADELAKLTQGKETAERANQREKERYDAAVESGKKRVAELSDRFADWYYVISDDVYKNIHLTEANVFRSATPDGEPSWGKDALDGIDLESILGTPQTPSPADHLPDLPGMEGLELDTAEPETKESSSELQQSEVESAE